MNLIRPLLTFRDDDDFYILEITQRRKDNPSMEKNSRTLRSYNIPNLEYLDSRWDEIRRICNEFNARATIRLNVRSYRMTAFRALELMASQLASGHHRLSDTWNKAASQRHNAANKTWVLDLDAGPDSVLNSAPAKNLLMQAIRDAAPHEDQHKIVASIPSKTGMHLITRPFDPRAFSAIYTNVEIQKDNPTNLYIP